MKFPTYTGPGTDSLMFWPAIILLLFVAFMLLLSVLTAQNL
mgnify:CR=1 FL=1